MKILGVDPGSLRCGWAVLDQDHLWANGIVCLKAKVPMPQRLAQIFLALQTVIRTHHPTVCVLEKSFVHKNSATALVLAQVRGVCLLLASLEGLEVQEKAPTAAKKNLTGHGQATKEQMMAMIKHIYGVDLASDAADAVALALSYEGGW